MPRSKVSKATPEQMHWERFDSRLLKDIQGAADYWGRYFNIDPEDLYQESVLYLAARDGGSVWWAVKKVADTRRKKLDNEPETVQLNEEGAYFV